MTATLNGLWGPQLRPSTLGKPEANPQSSLSYCFLICENLSSAQLSQRGHSPATPPGPGSGKGAAGPVGPLCSAQSGAQAAEQDSNPGLAAHRPRPSGKVREPQPTLLGGETERCLSPRTGPARTISTKAGRAVQLEAEPGKVTFRARELSPPPERETAWRCRPASPPFWGDSSADPTRAVGGRAPSLLPVRCYGQGGARLPGALGAWRGLTNKKRKEDYELLPLCTVWGPGVTVQGWVSPRWWPTPHSPANAPKPPACCAAASGPKRWPQGCQGGQGVRWGGLVCLSQPREPSVREADESLREARKGLRKEGGRERGGLLGGVSGRRPGSLSDGGSGMEAGGAGRRQAGSAHLRSIHIADVTWFCLRPVGHSGKAG